VTAARAARLRASERPPAASGLAIMSKQQNRHAELLVESKSGTQGVMAAAKRRERLG